MNSPSLPHVVVAILNWNGRHHLETYLPSVVEHSAGQGEVVVIDNGSTDDSIDWLRKAYPDVKVIALEENSGFAGGYNSGLAQIEADYFVLLNSDVRVTHNWIHPVIDMMEKDSFVACQPLICNDSDPDLFEYAGAAGGYIDRDGFTFCAGRIFEVFESNEGQYPGNREVFWASGAALFVNAAAYRSVGGLDNDFFAHMEEIDLCWRLKNRGYRVGVCGSSVVYHLGGGTLQKISPFKSYLNFRNNLYLLVKNHHRKPLYPMLIRRMALDGIAAIKFLSEGSTPLFGAVWKAHRDFRKQFKTMKQRRRNEIQSIRTGAVNTPCKPLNYAGWYRGSILIAYFLQRKQLFEELSVSQFMQSKFNSSRSRTNS